MGQRQVKNNQDWVLVCYLGTGTSGRIARIRRSDGQFVSHGISTVEQNAPGDTAAPVFLGLDSDDGILLMDPASKEIRHQQDFPSRAVAAYAYASPDGRFMWFMNDGDKETGNDELNCGTNGSSVAIIANNGQGRAGQASATHVKTICVGRGHHVTTFTYPTEQAPGVPFRAFVSNLIDGSISVIGTDSDNRDSYLEVIDTINLGDPQRDKDGGRSVPNNAFPHGKAYSELTGKIYSLNNGYGTIAVIDPIQNVIEATIEAKGISNLLLSPDGRYLIGKGADRKSNSDHVIGKLLVIDAQQGRILKSVEIEDLYPSTYRFNASGSKLYVTSAATGKGTQYDNLRKDVVQIYNTTSLPDIKLRKEIKTGLADCGRRPIALYEPKDEAASLIFVPNPTEASVSILHGQTDEMLATVELGGAASSDFGFSFWNGPIHGA